MFYAHRIAEAFSMRISTQKPITVHFVCLQ